MHSIGMPINFAELGAKKEDIPYLVKSLGAGETGGHGFVPLNAAAVTEILNIAAEAAIE